MGTLLHTLAAAGGGSSGFGGGGGGGGGGDGAFFLIYILLWLIAHPIALLFVLGFLAVAGIWSWAATARYRARRRERVQRVELAAHEAAQDDAAFAPDVVREQAAKLFREIQNAWSRGDVAGLKQLVGGDLMVEWERRLKDFERKGWRNRVAERKGWRNRVAIMSGPLVEYVGMTNRAEDHADRVVVRVEARLQDVVIDRYGNQLAHNSSNTTARTLAEYWTLGKRQQDGHWMLLSIEQRAEGDHHLSADFVTTPWDDTGRLRDEALVEGAAADALPEGTNAGELVSVSYADDARAAALDLSLVDGRFAPDILEVAVRRVVAAWTEAVDGSDEPLEAISTPEALGQLLHPNDPSRRTRLVVRGPRVLDVQIAHLDADAQPPRMTVAVTAEGRRYIENRDTAAVLAGSQSTATRFTEHWTLALDGSPDNPWRIVDAAAGRTAPALGA
jgi:predicted lipid-binding transport protein (Tim44 family)